MKQYIFPNSSSYNAKHFCISTINDVYGNKMSNIQTSSAKNVNDGIMTMDIHIDGIHAIHIDVNGKHAVLNVADNFDDMLFDQSLDNMLYIMDADKF